MLIDYAVAVAALGLATYALAQTIAYRDGPFDLLLRLRTALGAYDVQTYQSPDPFADPYMRPRRSTGRLIECPYCIGVWIALLLATATWWPPIDPLAWFIGWWATVGVQAFLQSRS